MIFVTVGSMVPFDRLIMLMDDWAAKNPAEKVFAQIGNGAYIPKHMEWAMKISPAEFEGLVTEAELVVAHAGMGTVLTALQIGRPMVLVPRNAANREHTTDHQLDTAKWLDGRPGLKIAGGEAEVAAAIAEMRAYRADSIVRIENSAPQQFIDRIRSALLS